MVGPRQVLICSGYQGCNLYMYRIVHLIISKIDDSFLVIFKRTIIFSHTREDGRIDRYSKYLVHYDYIIHRSITQKLFITL